MAVHLSKLLAVEGEARLSFDRIASDYDASRPGYPEQLVDDIVHLSAIPGGGRILEIGCGTGQATIPFARRGFQIDAVEMGQALAALTRHKCVPLPLVTVHESNFESFSPEPAAYDLVVSATAFHWIARHVRLAKSAYALRNTGYLAVFSNEHPLPWDGFFEEQQRIYRRFFPDVWVEPSTLPTIENGISDFTKEVHESGLFANVTVKTYAWSKVFKSDQYVRLLNSYSNIQSMEESRRLALLDEIRKTIEQRYAGHVTKKYLSVLFLTLKKQ